MGKYAKLTIITLLGLILCGIRSANAVEKIIIDTDAGADDAMAILLTLAFEPKGFEVVAITCSYGNTYLDNVVQNVLKTLTVANRSDIPVYKGASKALLKDYAPKDYYFGADGFGDFNFTEKITAKVAGSKHAAVALVDLVKQHPGEITLLNIGPLTNTALAIALEPSFLTYLKKHIVMGSSVSGLGNILPNVEFNFDQDPESNYIVMNHTRRSIVVPWETIVAGSTSMDWRLNVLGKLNSTIMKFLNNAERLSLEGSSSWTYADSMAAALIKWPEFNRKSVVTNLSPVFTGMARGSVLVDYTNLTGKPMNAEIVQLFDASAFKQILLDLFS